ncbi:UNVERIFIED_CONTAM: hypothetical protein FKN15_021868 [Acipenser sinensis]
MAAEALESQAVVGDTGLTKNNSESDSDTPRLVVSQKVEPRPPAATLTPDEVSESPRHRMAPSSVSADGATLATPTKRGGPPQEAADARTSTPGRSYEQLSSEQNGSLLERQESVATTEARLRMEGVELKEEWQDEDFPRYSNNEAPMSFRRHPWFCV